MDPTSLPTDNLYKFMALAGLATVFASLWLHWKHATRFDARLNEAHRQVAQSRGKQAKLAYLLQRAGELAGEDKAEAERLAATANDLSAEIAHDGEALHVTADANLAEADRPSVPYWILYALVVIGALTCGQGFHWWYFRLQVIQDAATIDAAREQKAKADLATAELNRAKAGP